MQKTRILGVVMGHVGSVSSAKRAALACSEEIKMTSHHTIHNYVAGNASHASFMTIYES